MRKFVFVLSVFVLGINFQLLAQAGLVYTVAGGGTSIADGVPALSARTDAHGVCIDAAGNIYFSDRTTHSVKKVDIATGLIETIAGNGVSGYSGDGGPATMARLNSPCNVCVDATGNIFISDKNNNAIRKVNGATGIISTIAAGIVASSRGHALTLDPAGNLYIGEWSNNVIRKVDAATNAITTIAGNGSSGYSGDGGPATNASIMGPLSLAVDFSGNLYIGEWMGCVVRKVNLSTGIISTIAGNGTAGDSGDGGPATASLVERWSEVAVDFLGNLFIYDFNTHVLRKVDATTGIINKVQTGHSDGEGMPLEKAKVNANDIFIDAGANIYFTTSSGKVRKINASMSYYGVSADSFSVTINKLCDGPHFVVSTHHYTSGLSLRTDFGDGNVNSTTVSIGLIGGYVKLDHVYAHSGNFMIRQVLYNGPVALDSISYTYCHTYCRSIPVRYYYDANSNCIYEPANDISASIPVTAEIDSNGIVVDKITAIGGFNYLAYGVPGDNYKVRVIGTPPGLATSCPTTGALSNTLHGTSIGLPTNYFGFSCTTIPGFDLQEYVTSRAGKHMFRSDIVVQNIYCTPMPSALTMQLSPKYTFFSSYPLPTSISGNTITWNFSNLSSTISTPMRIHFDARRPFGTPDYLPGDTVNSNYSINPISGDANPSDNFIFRVDTVKSSFDPNYVEVLPSGHIPSGTELTYTVGFENTGNDTAHNIYVLDSLPEYLDPSTLEVVAASHNMYLTKIKEGIFNRARFDFPDIMLPDSTHHDLCHGMFVFKIKTKAGLPNGTIIPNQVGIYFDDNPVVMTNTVNNIIGFPTNVTDVQNADKVEIYPNPSYNQITITAPNKITQIMIINLVGQTVFSNKYDGEKVVVNIEALPTGVYFIRVNGTEVRKFVKQ